MKLSAVDTIVATKADWDRITLDIKYILTSGDDVHVRIGTRDIRLGNNKYSGVDKDLSYRAPVLAAAREYQAVLKQRLALLGVDDFDN